MAKSNPKNHKSKSEQTVLRFPPLMWILFEDHKVKKMKSVIWFPMPLFKHDSSDRFYDLVRIPDGDGLKLYGALIALVQVAMTSPQRGYFIEIRGGVEVPHTAETIAPLCVQDAHLMRELIDRLEELRWLERVQWPLTQESISEMDVAREQRCRKKDGFIINEALDKAIEQLSGYRFADQTPASQVKIERAIKEHSEKLLYDKVRDTLRNPPKTRTLANALLSLSFDEARRQKDQADQPPEEPEYECW